MHIAAELAAGAYEYGVIERSLESFLVWLDAHPHADVRDFTGFRPPPGADLTVRGASAGEKN